MKNDKIKAFVDNFIKALLAEGDIDKAMSFLAKNGISNGYMGEKGSKDRDEIKEAFIRGKERGNYNYDIEYFGFDISSPAENIYTVIVDCELNNTKDESRNIKKRIIFTLVEKDEDIKIHLLDFSLIYQNNIFKLKELEVHNKALNEELKGSIRRFNAAVAHTALSIWEYDIEKKQIHQMDNAMDVHGFDRIIENVPDFLIEIKYVHPESAKSFIEMYDKIKSGEKQVGGTFKVLNKTRDKYWWEKITYLTEFDAMGKPVKAIGFSTDVTEHVDMCRQLERISLQKQALARNAILTAVGNLSTNEIIDLDMNDYFDANLLKHKELSELVKSYVINNVSKIHRVEIEKFLKRDILIEEYDKGNRVYQYDYVHLLPNGDEIWAVLNLEVDKDEVSGHYIANCYMENIDKRKKKELKAKKEAELDPLTGVYNRLAFKILAENAISRNPNDSLTVFGLVDIDDFKSINDTEGHYYGDLVLVKLAEILKKCFRQNDIVGRLGGDEFVFVLTNVNSIEFIKKKFHNLFREIHSMDLDIDKPITISLGIAITPWDGNDFETLYKKADLALYNAKKSGKNKWCIYDEKIELQ